MGFNINKTLTKEAINYLRFSYIYINLINLTLILDRGFFVIAFSFAVFVFI